MENGELRMENRKKIIGRSYSSLHYFEPYNSKDSFRIKPKKVPLQNLFLLSLFYLIFGVLASLGLYYYKSDIGIKALIPLGLAIFTAIVGILYTIITYYLEQQKGDILIYDKNQKRVILPRMHLELTAANVYIEVVRGTTSNKDMVAEMHIIDKKTERRSLLITRFASWKSDFSDITTAIQKNTPITVKK